MTSSDAAIPIATDVDHELVRRVARGSADALADLYDRHAPGVFGMARRILGDVEDAEEVVQDVFAQVWRQAARYETSRASVSGWMLMLARTRAIDRLRRRRARPDEKTAVDSMHALETAAVNPDPEEAVISDREARGVRDALVALPPAQRSLVDLAFFDGLTHTEISARTGVPLGTVKTRIRTAMTALRGALRS